MQLLVVYTHHFSFNSFKKNNTNFNHYSTPSGVQIHDGSASHLIGADSGGMYTSSRPMLVHDVLTTSSGPLIHAEIAAPIFLA